MSRLSLQMTAGVIVAIVIAACGADGQSPASSGATAPGASAPRAHPQAVEPIAGVSAASADGGAAVVGNVNDHAPTLAQVKRELRQLNLCGGAISVAQAQPLVKSTGPGFTPDPGTIQTVGQLPQLTAQIDALGKALGVIIYGISGYRTPAHSVAVGGFANDPHTKGLAEDVGVGSLLRSSAAQISETQLAQYGIYRPFDPSNDPNNSEVNHWQLIPAAGPLTLAQSTATFDPDPSCK